MNRFRKFISQSGINQFSWLNPLFLALFPALVIIWLQPIYFSPYLFEIYKAENINTTVWFEDLENDGQKEKILLGDERVTGNAFIDYCNDHNQRINQFNFHYPTAKTRERSKPYCVDLNNDLTKEVVIFTQNKDSVFINIFDFNTEKACVSNRFVTTIGGLNEYHDYSIASIGHFDANNDSVPEYYFSVSSGFALYPRRIFRYDFANDSLVSSINTGAATLSGRIGTNKDSMLLIAGSYAHGNTRENYPYPYHDTTSWIFTFDKNLKLKFPPRSYGINPGGIMQPTFIDEFIYYTVGTNNAQKVNKLYKMDWQGELIDSLVFDFYTYMRMDAVSYNDNTYYIFYDLETMKCYYLDTTKFNYYDFPNNTLNGNNRIFAQLDLNKDGIQETFFYNYPNFYLELYNSRFKKLGIQIDAKDPRFISSNYFEDEKYGECIINTDKQAKVYRYYLNPNLYYKYPLWLAIYLVSFLFVAFILYFQNQRLQKRQTMEQKLADLQLQNLLSQLDPHFTFNVLNSVGNAIYKQDKEGAYDLFQRFTRIIRSSLMSSDKVFRSLKEELRFTQDYLDFQKLRFKNRFDYSIDIEKSLDTSTISILKMLIQGFAENAVKHAFYGAEYTGQINIRVFSENNLLKVIIEDDGIGIKRSKELKITSGTQKGEFIIKEQIRQLNKLYNTNYSLQIIDKSDLNQNKSGTEIIISSWLRLLDNH